MPEVSESHPRVLLVDDEPEILAELREGLDVLGIPCLTAEASTAALELVQRHEEIKVVVTDLLMPNIDGIEFMQKMSRRFQSRPIAVIVITGHASLDKAVSALRLQAVDFLQKPLSAEEVAHAISRAFALLEGGGIWREGGVEVSRSITKPNYLKALLAVRTDRNAVFGSNLFQDPAWEMMLDLAVSEVSGWTLSVTSLCVTSGVPVTTALRRLDELETEGLVERAPAANDRRRIIVCLTEKGHNCMEEFLLRHTKRLGLSMT